MKYFPFRHLPFALMLKNTNLIANKGFIKLNIFVKII